ncbi:hypothetical protein FACS1894122_01550 [Alphaproteobacteria bacterium]|nr:hypothetical protein FACS1894122_01550 [Alphaproteobacteria bacterium]
MNSRIRLQPLVDLNDGSALGYEALYNRENSCEFPSASYILRDVVSECKSEMNFHLFINMTVADAADEKFYDNFMKTMDDLEINGDKIVLELNEGTHPELIERTKRTFSLLRRHNVKIALDDFGTKYSTMEYMNELPVDIVKIDQKFVQSAPYSRKSRSMLKFAANLSHDIGCQVVAEGIENRDHLDCVMEAKIDIGQGFLFLTPSPKMEVQKTPFINLNDFVLYISSGFSKQGFQSRLIA